MIKPSPHMIKPSPHMIKPSPHMIKPSPHMIKPSPRMIKPSPQMLQLGHASAFLEVHWNQNGTPSTQVSKNKFSHFREVGKHANCQGSQGKSCTTVDGNLIFSLFLHKAKKKKSLVILVTYECMYASMYASKYACM